MTLGLRRRIPFPWILDGMRIVRTHGRVFGFPAVLEQKIIDRQAANSLEQMINRREEILRHPAVISAPTLEEILPLVAAYDYSAFVPEYVGTCENYRVARMGNAWYGVPAVAPDLDLNLPEERRAAGVLSAHSREELEARIQATAAAEAVEFAGWLPVYAVSGNCGNHPQFGHVADPPEGYRFTCSAPPQVRSTSRWRRLCGGVVNRIARRWRQVSSAVRPLLAAFRRIPGVRVRDRVRTLRSVARLGWRLWRGGMSPGTVLRFLQTRHFQSQAQVAKHQGLVFLTSMPYTFGQNPWVVEIEDPTTLFYPMIQNGGTCEIEVEKSPFYPAVKELLESDSCRGIITHMRSTARMLPALFPGDKVRDKVFYHPLGVKVPTRWQRHDGNDDTIDLLFINSWCQAPSNFYLRGGLDVLAAFDILRERYPQLRLTLRTNLPDLAPEFLRIIESGWVRVIHRLLTPEEMADLHASSHVFLLPAARVHIVSLLQAMSYGLPVVGSDGWGMEEYLEHERNGLVVKGRYGKASWADEEAGVLREDYEAMYTADPEVVEGLVVAISRLVEDRQLRARLGRTARQDVETRYNLTEWNRGLQQAFGRARGVSRPAADAPVERAAFLDDPAEREAAAVHRG